MANTERQFLDQAGLKQAFKLIKDMISGTKTELMAEIGNANTGSGTALSEAKAELEGKISTAETTAATNLGTAKTELEGKISNAETVAANNLATAKTALEASIATLQQNLADTSLKFKVVSELPTLANADVRTVYLVLDQEEGKTADENNIYIEYLVVVDDEGNKVRFEEIGDTQLSLEDYDKITTVNEKIAVAKQETLKVVDDAKYVESANYISTAEVVAIFKEAPVMMKANGEITQYATVEEAIVAAETGDTVVLGKDAEIAESTVIADGVVIDLNGFVMNVKAGE